MIELNLNSSLFKPAYLVYAIKVKYEGKVYVYIGQTGDAHYHSARPLFSRLGGHFQEVYSSTQNQVYAHMFEVAMNEKGVKEEERLTLKKAKLMPNKKYLKNEVRLRLKSMDVQIMALELEQFDDADEKAKHYEKRKIVLEAEKYIIQETAKALGKTAMINKKTTWAKEIELEEELAGTVSPLLEWAIDKNSFSSHP